MVEIRNAHIEDSNKDGLLQAGEECQVMFDIMNHSSQTLYNVQPVVLEVSSNKDIHISPNLMVESIAPNSGVRYTATILADKKLKDGKAVIRVGVMVGKTEITSQLKEFTVETRKN